MLMFMSHVHVHIDIPYIYIDVHIHIAYSYWTTMLFVFVMLFAFLNSTKLSPFAIPLKVNLAPLSLVVPMSTLPDELIRILSEPPVVIPILSDAG